MPRRIPFAILQPDETTLEDIETLLTAMGGNVADIEIINTGIETAVKGIEMGAGEDGLILEKLNDIDVGVKTLR